MGEATEQSPRQPVPRPVLQIVRGDATAEEVAALVAVLSARAAADTGTTQNANFSNWANRSRQLRTPLPHGPGGWRASGLPR